MFPGLGFSSDGGWLGRDPDEVRSNLSSVSRRNTSNTCYSATDLNRSHISYRCSGVRRRSVLCLIVFLDILFDEVTWGSAFELWTSDWPAGPRPLDPSCGCVDRLRFCWRWRFPPVERAVRICTSLTLKNATMKGCFSSAPSRPTSPASLELMLCPVPEDTALKNYNINHQSCFSYILWSVIFVLEEVKQLKLTGKNVKVSVKSKHIYDLMSYRCWSPRWPAGPGCEPGSLPTGCWWQWCQTPASPPQPPTACETPAGTGLPLWKNIQKRWYKRKIARIKGNNSVLWLDCVSRWVKLKTKTFWVQCNIVI